MIYLVNPLDGGNAAPRGYCYHDDPGCAGFCLHCPQNALYCDFPATPGYSPTSNPPDSDK